MKRIIMTTFALLAVAGCSSDKGQEMAEATLPAPVEQEAVVFNIVGQTFYNEFIPCTGGPDYSREAVAEMVADWRNLGISGDILGSWGFEPASDDNQYENGWWELQWTNKEAADKGWQEWAASEDAQVWSEKYASVMTCDGPNRVSWDFHFARDPYSFGELGASGEFFSAFLPCNLNEGKTMADADAAIELYNGWLDNLNAEEVSFYAYGIYASNAGSTEVDLYWGNFHESAEAMQRGDEMWMTTGGEAKAAVEAVMTCGNPDLHNSKVFYDPADPDFS